MHRKSGFTDPVTCTLIVCATLTIISWFHGSRCNNLKISGDSNTVYQTLSPQGGDTVSIPLTTKDGKTVMATIPKGAL